MKIKIIWDNDSTPVADKKVKEVVDTIITNAKLENNIVEVRVCNETVVNQFRIAILQQSIGLDDIEFYFDDILLECNKDARFEWYPVGFCDVFNRQLNLLLGWDNE